MEILKSIITSIGINMMNFFALYKVSPKMFFHYKNVFANIPTLVSTWVTSLHNFYIPIAIYSTAMPCGTLFPGFRSTALTATIKIGVSWGIIIAGAKLLTTRLTAMYRYLATSFRWGISNLFDSLFNKNIMAMSRTSFSLAVRADRIISNLRACRAGVPTNNTFIHNNNIIPAITCKVKEARYVY